MNTVNEKPIHTVEYAAYKFTARCGFLLFRNILRQIYQ